MKAFLVVKDNMGLCSVYWLHAIIAILAAVVAFFLLPETKNKTYTELSKMFAKEEQTDFDVIEYDNKLYKDKSNVDAV